MQDLPSRATTASGSELVLAQPRGFCAGVDRAIDIVERALEALRARVQTVVVAVEHGRYAPPDFAPPAEDLVSAVDVVRTSLATHSPLSMRAWLWPRSIMSRQAWAHALLRRLDRLRGRA